jgi:hypothetical protein
MMGFEMSHLCPIDHPQSPLPLTVLHSDHPPTTMLGHGGQIKRRFDLSAPLWKKEASFYESHFFSFSVWWKTVSRMKGGIGSFVQKIFIAHIFIDNQRSNTKKVNKNWTLSVQCSVWVVLK